MRIDAVHLAGGQEHRDRGPDAATTNGTNEQRIIARDSQRTECPFDNVTADLDQWLAATGAGPPPIPNLDLDSDRLGQT